MKRLMGESHAWWSRSSDTFVRTHSDHYFGLNCPDWEQVFSRGWLHCAMAVDLALKRVHLRDWLSSVPLVEKIHDCVEACGAR